MLVFLSDAEIDEAKKQHQYVRKTSYHCHNDCIRIAYQFFDAQKIIKNPTTLCFDFKRMIKVWAGCYVTFADVEIAAVLHPRVIGKFPYYNISCAFIEPSTRRLQGIQRAFTIPYCDPHLAGYYKRQEHFES